MKSSKKPNHSKKISTDKQVITMQIHSSQFKKLVYLLFSPKGSLAFTTVSTLLFFMLYAGQQQAQSQMSNDSYRVEWPNLSPFTDKADIPAYNPASNEAEVIPGLYVSTVLVISKLLPIERSWR